MLIYNEFLKHTSKLQTISLEEFHSLGKEELFKFVKKNKSYLGECKKCISLLSVNDFKYEWEFYSKQTSVFDGVQKLLFCILANLKANILEKNLINASMDSIDIIKILFSVKCISFISEVLLAYIFQESAIIFLHKNKNSIPLQARKQIVETFLSLFEKMIIAKYVAYRDMQFSKMFNKDKIKMINLQEAEAYINDSNNQQKEIGDFFSWLKVNETKETSREEMLYYINLMELYDSEIKLLALELAITNHIEIFGKPPDKILDLFPDFLSENITDDFTNSEFKYIVNENNNYLVYTPGPTGKDHGGKIGPINQVLNGLADFGIGYSYL